MNASIVVFLLALLAGAGLIVGGVYVLAGLGWSLVAGGACSWAFAGFLRRGMTGG